MDYISETRKKFLNRNIKLKLNQITIKILNRRYLYIIVAFLIVFILQMLTIDIVIGDKEEEEKNETSTPSHNNSLIIPEYDSDPLYEDTMETSGNINSNTACDYSLGIHRYVCCSWDCIVAFQPVNIGQQWIGCWVTGALRCEISMRRLYSTTFSLLKINHNVSSLTINGTVLQEIENGAFNIPPLEGLLFLTLQLRGLKILHSESFQGLKNVISLYLQEMASLSYAEKGILYPMKKYLSQLQIQSLQNNACEIITNFTGVSTIKLTQLKIVDFSHNNLMMVRNDTFLSITSSQLLYLHYSNISFIHSQAFQPTIRTVTQIFLHNNALEHLNSDLFSNQKRLQNVTLADNHWNCDCSLSWLQNWEESKHRVSDEPLCSYPQTNKGKNFSDAVFCNEFNNTSTKVTSISTDTTKDVSVTDSYISTTVKENDSSNILSTTVIFLSTQSTDNLQTIGTSASTEIGVTTIGSTSTKPCDNSNKISWRSINTCSSNTQESETPHTEKVTTKSFITSTVPESQKSTTVMTKESSSLTTDSSTDDGNITVIWCQDFVTETYKQIGIKPAKVIEVFPNNILAFPPETQELSIIHETDQDENVEITLKVPHNSTLLWMTHDTNDQVPHCIFGLKEEVKLTLYQHDQEYMFCVLKYSLIMSPFSCIAHKTMPIYNERAWIKNKDKDIFIAVCIGIVIITLVFGIISVYAFIRRYPKLIRGKRVLVVKHRIADVLILPKEHDANILNEDSVELSDDHKVFCETNNLTIRDGGTCSSASSYVTVNEPAPIDLIAFRFEQTINKLRGLQNTKEESKVTVSK